MHLRFSRMSQLHCLVTEQKKLFIHKLHAIHPTDIFLTQVTLHKDTHKAKHSSDRHSQQYKRDNRIKFRMNVQHEQQ